METQVEQLDGDRVRLTVDVPAQDVHHAVAHAASDLAQSVRIPGFRKGKVPMPVLVQKVGRDRIYQEAVESHIGSWFWNAAARSRVQPADWTQLEVPKLEIEVPEEAVQEQLQELQRTAADLAPVDGRPAQPGDVVVVDLVSENGEAQRDYVVELGSDRLVEEIENGIRGLSAGESRDIAYELADGNRREASVTVKEIREKVLPPLDDELARATSEFDRLDDLRGDIEARMREQIDDEIEGRFRAAAVDELVKATNVQAAGPLVEARTQELANGLMRQLQARGVDPNLYFQMTGQTPEALAQRLRAEATQSVARELVLEAVADKLGLAVTDDEIREELRAAGENDEDIDEFIAQGGADRVRDDLRMRKALDRIAAEVKPISPELANAREKLWKPGQEAPAAETKLWTPGSKE
jgi:trigger factor